MTYLISLFSATIWMAIGSMLMRWLVFRRRTRLTGIGLGNGAMAVFAITLAVYGVHPAGVPGDLAGAAKVYLPAAVLAGLVQTWLARRRRL